MTDREKIAQIIAPHMRLTSFNPDNETQELNKLYALEVADAILAALSEGEADQGVVGEIDALYSLATDGPWALLKGDDLSVDAHQEIFSPKCTGATPVSTLKANAALIVKLVNAWPTLRKSLSPIREWRPIESAPKDGTHFLAGQWFVDGGRPEFDCAVTWWSHTWGFGGDTRVEQPTHWMPLPPPPIDGEGEDG